MNIHCLNNDYKLNHILTRFWTTLSFFEIITASSSLENSCSSCFTRISSTASFLACHFSPALNEQLPRTIQINPGSWIEYNLHHVVVTRVLEPSAAIEIDSFEKVLVDTLHGRCTTKPRLYILCHFEIVRTCVRKIQLLTYNQLKCCTEYQGTVYRYINFLPMLHCGGAGTL